MPFARRTFVLALAAAGFLAAPLAAQSFDPRDRDTGPPRGAAGGSLDYAAPTGDFHRYVRQGFGIDGFFRWNTDPEGIFGIRVDGGFVIYGHERKRVPLSSTIGGRILVDLTTSNNIIWFGIGPQLTLPFPSLQPYFNASVGFAYFFTESSVAGSNFNSEPFASTRNFSDAAFDFSVGGGVLIPLGSSRASLDLGVRYLSNGQVAYLREGSIEDQPDGSIVLHPIRSDANLLLWRLGVSVSIP